MIHNNRLTVKKLQLALRRLIKGESISDKHSINKYINRELLRSKIENHFLEGMTWHNFGDIWEISHILPTNMFDHTNEEHLKLCWSEDNIIPMFKQDNKDIGSCPLFAKEWFKNKNEEKYIKYKSFINNKLEDLSKYFI